MAVLFAAGDARGQAPDPLGALTPPDSVQTKADSATVLEPIDLNRYAEGERSDSLPLAGRYAHDALEVLDDLPGAFRFTLGNLGWPDQISLRGASPNGFSLTVDGLPIQDPVTGRPLFEVIPFDLLHSPAHYAGKHGALVGAGFATRRYDVRQPHTELRYRAGGPGLQSISATHVQQRRIVAFGSPTVLQLLFRYAGGSWNGDYPNSSSDASQLYARVGLIAPGWALRVANLHTRRNGGAHGGVEIRGGSFDSIFTRFNARVFNPTATFRLKRNELRISLDRTILRGVDPMQIEYAWTSHVRRHRETLPTEAHIHEHTLSAAQELPGAPPGHRLVARVISRFDDVSDATVFPDQGDLDRSSFEALLESESDLGNADVSGHVGWIKSAGHTIPQIRAAFEGPLLGLRFQSEFASSGRIPSRLEVAGSGHVAPAAVELGFERTNGFLFTVERTIGVYTIDVGFFASSTAEPIELWEVATGSFSVTQSAGAFTRRGFIGGIGWRMKEERGLYGEWRSTIQGSSVSGDDPFLTALANSLPAFQWRLKTGARMLLFQGDLDVNVYAVGRYWSALTSRVFDPITGAMALPRPGARTIGNSGALDLRLEAGIRTATVFVGFENALAGMSYPGTVIVPNYPLPAQAFRFGVLWPIDG